MRGGTESLKKEKNFLGGCVNMIFVMFSVGRVNSNRVHRMLTVHALELPSFGTENHYFSKGELWGFSFDVVWGGLLCAAMWENVEGKVGVCICV